LIARKKKKPPSYATAAFSCPKELVDVDEDPGTIVPILPVSMMIFMRDESMMGTMVVPIAALVMRPRIVMIVGE
jgi:hypothetical protein